MGGWMIDSPRRVYGWEDWWVGGWVECTYVGELFSFLEGIDAWEKDLGRLVCVHLVVVLLGCWSRWVGGWVGGWVLLLLVESSRRGGRLGEPGLCPSRRRHLWLEVGGLIR